MPSLPNSKHATALRHGQFRHVIRVAAVTGRLPERNVMLLWFTHTTGIRVTELSLLEIRDLMFPSGQLRTEIYLRSAITKHGRPRTIYLSHPKAIIAVEAWLSFRIDMGWEHYQEETYRGFKPKGRFVLTHKGRAFELARKRRLLDSGPAEYLCCDALQQAMSRVYRQAGIKGGSSHSGRRTLAARVLADSGSVELVQQVLGHSELDHTWPYLDVDKKKIRLAFELAL